MTFSVNYLYIKSSYLSLYEIYYLLTYMDLKIEEEYILLLLLNKRKKNKKEDLKKKCIYFK